MAIIKWSIVDLERHTVDGYVHQVAYRVDGSEDGYFACFTDKAFLTRPVDELVPFEDLTEALVLSWIQDLIGADAVPAIERGIEAELQDQISPRVAHGLPWDPAQTE
jgi:hypothetical protein